MSARLALQSPAPSTATGVPPTRLRLTRRGRLLLIGLPLLTLASLLLTFLGVITAPVMAAGSGSVAGVNTMEVTVVAGESLWSLATELAPDRDPREVIAEIVELNGLSSSILTAGQPLSIPVGR